MNNVAKQLIFDQQSIILLTSSILNLIVFIFLRRHNLRENNKSKDHLSNSILGISLWMFFSWLNHFIQNSLVVTLLARSSFSIGIIIIFYIYSFAKSWINQKVRKWVKYSTLITFLLTLTTPLVIKEEIPATLNQIEQPVWGGGFKIWSLFVLLLIFLTITQFIKTLKLSRAQKREKIKAIVILLTFGILVTAIFNVILPNLGIVNFIFVGQYSTILMAIGSTWIVLQERIYTTRFLISKFVATSIIGLSLFIISWVVQKIEYHVFGWELTDFFNFRIFFFSYIIASILGVIIVKYIDIVKDSVTSIFKIRIQSLENLNQWLIKKSNKDLDIEVFINEFLKKLKDFTGSQQTVLYLETNEIKKLWTSQNSVNLKAIQKRIEARNTSPYILVFKIQDEEKIVGFVYLEKNRNYYFSKEEVTKIKRMTDLLKMVVNKYILFLKQKQHNKKLKVEVEKATEKLRKANVELQASSKLKTNLMMMANHELRTPVTVVNNYLFLLEQAINENKNEDALQHLEKMKSATSRLGRVVKTMNQNLSVLNKDDKMEVEAINIDKIIQEVVESKESEELVNSVKVDFNKGDGAKIVLGDESRLHYVVWEIITNAIKFSGDNKTVKVTTKRIDSKVEIKISDEGQGISEELLDKVFKESFVVESVENKHIEGFGLGLFLVKKIIDKHKGEIKVKSKVGEGTEVTIILNAHD